MKGKERRELIASMLNDRKEPITGKSLANEFNVSRQVIVQDVALLRAEGYDIVSTTYGYILRNQPELSRVFKVQHKDEETEEELNLIVDYGGVVKDVFIYHRIYGVVQADLDIKSRNDVQLFLDNIKNGKSSLLMNVTSNYHYHTVYAPTKAILDLIQEKLSEKGFLAKLQEYEPVDFWTMNQEK